MKLNLRRLTILLVFAALVFAQGKKPLDHSVYAGWKLIQAPKISNDGKWSAYLINPSRGDGQLCLTNLEKGSTEIFPRGKDAVFSSNSNFIAFKVAPEFAKTRSLKIAKKKADDLPKDTLFVKNIVLGKVKKYSECKTFNIPDKNSDWFAAQFEKEQPAKTDTAKSKVKSKIKKEGTKLLVANPLTEKEYYFQNVAEYSVAKNGGLVGFISMVKDSLDSCSVYVFDTKLEKAERIFYQKGFVKNPIVDEKGTQAVFMFSTDTASVKNYNLYYWDVKTKTARLLIDSLNSSMTKGNTVSPFYKPRFSEDGSKLYFGTAKRLFPEPKDTLLAEEKAVLDLWSWTDPLLQPQQLKELNKEKERSYLAFYNFQSGKMLQLGNDDLEDISTFLKGNADYYLGSTNKETRKMISWDQEYNTYYFIDGKTGSKKLLQKNLPSIAKLSPGGKYFVWYQTADSSWYSMDVAKGNTTNLTKSLKLPFYDILHDTPALPYPAGITGFSKNDTEVLINDNNDIWVFDLTGKKAPYSLTGETGRKNNLRFNYVKTDPEEEYIDLSKSVLLGCFNLKTKQNGFYKVDQDRKPALLVMENNTFPFFAKAKDADNIIFRKGNFNSFTELYTSGIDFKNVKILTDANPQMKNYLWGSVELVKWNSTQGVELEGLLYKPENFDPAKKYPMIVYFYERDSETLFSHYIPSPSRSIINIPYFTSNDYVVFVPDIPYTVGYPGQSAVDAIVSGTLAMIDKGFINKKAVGLQGQSWGGYQTAYLITRTNLYAAAGAGAPVSNMTSAYGGIRWESGMSRMFQYEKTQSRIGGTLWEKPMQYIENSPLFFADKVNTPLFMTHNDNDGAVPWYQGIEYFTALRRLNKPVWLVNYNGDAHNLKAESWGNRVDLSQRLAQFFDYYLKGAPMPEWMKTGIPAIQKGKTLGY